MAIGDPPTTVEHLMRKVREVHKRVRKHHDDMDQVAADAAAANDNSDSGEVNM